MSARRSPGLRLVVFLLAALAAGPLVGIAVGTLGLSGVPGWAYAGLVSIWLLGLTWGAVRSEGGTLRTLGLVPTRRRVREFAVGFGLAAGAFAAVALVRAASVGAEWTVDPVAGARAAVLGLPLALVLLLPEELLFRGYAFQKAVARWGAPAALAASTLAFGAYHVVGSGAWGMGALFLFVLPALGGLLFGVAALRTGGLALPTGLHLGGNWVNASVLGLGTVEGGALWAAPLDAAQVAALTAPDVVPHLPYVGALALLAVAVAGWPRTDAVGARAPSVRTEGR